MLVVNKGGEYVDDNKTNDTNDQTVPADSKVTDAPVVSEDPAVETPAAEAPEATIEPEAPKAEETQAPVAEPEAPKEEAQAESTPVAAAPAGTDQHGRQLYNAKCSTCGRDIQVPFQPTEGRPVYCKEDFMKMRGGQ